MDYRLRDALVNVSSVIADAITREPVFEAILTECLKLVEATSGAVFLLYNQNDFDLICSLGHGKSEFPFNGSVDDLFEIGRTGTANITQSDLNPTDYYFMLPFPYGSKSEIAVVILVVDSAEIVSSNNGKIALLFSELCTLLLRTWNYSNNLKLLSDISNRTHMILTDKEQLAKSVCRNVIDVISADIVSISILSNGTKDKVYTYAIDLGEEIEKTGSIDGTLTEWVISHKTEFVSKDIASYPPPVIPKTIKTKTNESPQSLIFLPLIVEDTCLGAISAQGYAPNAFSGFDLRFMKTIAEFSAIALANSRYFARRVSELDALGEIDREIVASKSLQEILRYIGEKAFRLTRANRGNILLFDPMTQTIKIEWDEGSAEEYKNARQKLGEGVTGNVALSKKSRLIEDVRNVEEYVSFIPDMLSEAAAPILIGHRLIGVVNVEHAEKSHFDQSDLHFLEILSGQAAIAIYGHELREKLDELRKISRQISAMIDNREEMQNTLDMILKGAVGLVKAKYGDIMYYDSLTGRLEMRSSCVIGDEKVDSKLFQDVGEGVVGTVFRTGQPLYIPDVKDSEWVNIYMPTIPNIRSELAVPMRSEENKIVGVLNVESLTPYGFFDDDQYILQILADQAQIVFHLIEEEKARAEQDALFRIAEAVAHPFHQIRNTINFILNDVNKLTKDLDPVITNSLNSEVFGPLLQLRDDVDEKYQRLRNIRRERRYISWSEILEHIKHIGIPENVDLIIESQEDVRVYVEDSVFDMFVNLVTNAIQHLPEPSLGPRRITLNVETLGEWVQFIVSDSGHGIKQEFIDNGDIFQLRFTKRDKRFGTGMGIGLFQVKRFVLSHHGRISVESKLGEGTTFRIVLPVKGDKP